MASHYHKIFFYRDLQGEEGGGGGRISSYSLFPK